MATTRVAAVVRIAGQEIQDEGMEAQMTGVRFVWMTCGPYLSEAWDGQCPAPQSQPPKVGGPVDSARQDLGWATPLESRV